MYKDPDKQREANRQASKKYRDSMTGKGMMVAPEIIPKRLEHEQYYHQVHCNAPSHVKQFAKGVSCSCPKRGKDIKVFEDLPPDVQQTINLMSQRAGKIDSIEKINRTSRAIRYQHLFPDRYNSAGVA